MTENFILSAFRTMGEEPETVKLMRNKYTGEPAGYCFVNFSSDDRAIDAMHKLNGKPIPGTNPIVRFRLNSASSQNKMVAPIDREFSVWVGDLSAEVDDYSLYRAFASKYNSIRSAKVILDGNGFSKGYGFVRFGMEDEQMNALYDMNGYVGLGSKALKICNAVPKPKGDMTAVPEPPSATTIVQNAYAAAAAAEYSQYYDPSTYWQNYSNWGYQQQADPSQYYQQQQQMNTQQWSMYNQQEPPPEDEDMTLVGKRIIEKIVNKILIIHTLNDFIPDYKYTIDTDALNREAIERDKNLYDAIESSKWSAIEILEVF